MRSSTNIVVLSLTAIIAMACGDRELPVQQEAGAPDIRVDRRIVDPPLDKGVPVDAPPPPIPTIRYPQTIEKEVDILFVIDNSGSMAQEQQNLRENFGKMIEGLRSEKFDGNPPNVHIGIVTTDVGAGNYGAAIPSCETPNGDRGALQDTAQLPGCPSPSDPWINYQEGVTNVAGCQAADPIECVKEAFNCIAALGIEGCGFEQTLESARRALEPELNTNPGFLRQDALLAVLFVTDEDDCSAAKPQLFDPTQQGLQDPLGPLTSFRCFEFGIQCDINDRLTPGPRQNCVPAFDWLHKVDNYIDFFAKLKGGKDRVVMAAITGPTGRIEVGKDGTNPTLLPSCRTDAGFAVPAIRLEALIDAFNGLKSSICTNDFGPALDAFGKRIGATLSGQCITAALRTENGGVACHAGVDVCGESCLDQADCEVSLVNAAGVRAAVPRCPSPLFDPAVTKDQCGASCPCWRIVPRPDECTRELNVSPFGLEIMRTDQAATGSYAEMRCAVAAESWFDSSVQSAGDHCR